MSQPSYETNDPKGWCGDPSRGAALGRPSVSADEDFSGTILVRQMRICSQGYDQNGTYFGIGEPIFWIASIGGEIDETERASSLQVAIKDVQERYPLATVAESADEAATFDDFFDGYLTASLFTSTDDSVDEGGEPGDTPMDQNYNISDFAEEASASMRQDCMEFFERNKTDIMAGPLKTTCTAGEQAGHDFWLTRGGFGCGFNDGDWPEEAGERLYDDARKQGEVNLYIGDDKKVHCG